MWTSVSRITLHAIAVH